MGQPGNRPRGHREAARHHDGLPFSRTRADGGSRQIAVVPAPERHLEIPRVAAPVGAPDRFLPHGLQRCRLGQHAGAGELADARLRHPHLHQHHLSVAAGRVEGARSAVRVQPGRQLPHALHGAACVEGPADPAAFRRRRLGLLRLGQRAQARLQRGQPHAGRVRHHAAPEAGQQPAGGGGLPLRRRRLPGRPGHVAHERHLPRRLPVGRAGTAPARFRSEDRPGRRVSRRHAGGQGRALQRGGEAREGHRDGRAVRCGGRAVRQAGDQHGGDRRQGRDRRGDRGAGGRTRTSGRRKIPTSTSCC